MTTLFSVDSSFHELKERTPIAVFKARPDDYSFIEADSGCSTRPRPSD